MSTHDSRPLTGEPLALDLLNTSWVADGVVVDYLDDDVNLHEWLAANGIAGDANRAALVETRTAIESLLVHGDAPSRERLNRVLQRGSLRTALGGDGRVERTVEVAGPGWRPAVLAALNLVELVVESPSRIRRCAHPNCVLWFLDTSRSGTRRWCSMTGCGNRAKAKRHYSRSRQDG